MAAAIHNIIAEEGSDLVLDIRWYDSAGDAIDVDAYGAEFIMKKNKDRDSKAFASITHTASASGEITIGSVTGQFLVRVDNSVLTPITFESGYYQLTIWPIAAQPSNKRQRLVKGQVSVDISL